MTTNKKAYEYTLEELKQLNGDAKFWRSMYDRLCAYDAKYSVVGTERINYAKKMWRTALFTEACNSKDYDTIARLGADMTVDQLTQLTPDEYVVANWGDAGIKIVELISTKYANNPHMELDEFLNHCTACGGNWGGMVLTGIQELFPDVWELIPEHMGIFAFSVIGDVLNLLNVTNTKSN